ncbi:hypothetical protein [Comamonas sp. B-9]|uniref:hypothetical protein n=1 Tax=Comamonas sp. B-9 TaxID=1055192 RepID=UPI0011DDAE32|nr:hypothetical protein [Comamonas sp. B-9]
MILKKMLISFCISLFVFGCTYKNESAVINHFIKTDRNQDEKLSVILNNFATDRKYVASSYTLNAQHRIFIFDYRDKSGRHLASFIGFDDFQYHFSFYKVNNENIAADFLDFFEKNADFDYIEID